MHSYNRRPRFPSDDRAAVGVSSAITSINGMDDTMALTVGQADL